MSVDPESDRDDGDRLPPRPGEDAAAAAQARMLARVVAGGLEPAAPTTERIGPYDKIRPLGRGGMGEVWEARRAGETEGEPETVAIKVLRAAVIAHVPTRRRFMREASTAAALVHPRIVRVFDVGATEAGTPYIVMERVQGRPLQRLVEEAGALPWPAARRVLTQVGEGLAFAHDEGVVHRDLKPSNVMVRGDSAELECTIIDFGLARREVITSGSESLSRTGEVFGSPPFMSPEQFRGDSADLRSDIYSFGCLMFYVLTGRRPFEGDKIGELMYMHLFEPAPEPTGMDCEPRLRPALSSIVLRAMRKAPEQRFETMHEVVAALQRLDDDPRPVAVPRETPARGTARRAGMVPWLVAAAGVGAAAWALSAAGPSATDADEPRTSAPDTRPAAAASSAPSHPEPDPVEAPPPAVEPDPPPAARPAPDPPPPDEPDPAQAAPAAPEPAPAPPPAPRRPKPRKPEPSDPPPVSTTDDEPPAHAGSELPPNPFRDPPAGVDADEP